MQLRVLGLPTPPFWFDAVKTRMHRQGRLQQISDLSHRICFHIRVVRLR